MHLAVGQGRHQALVQKLARQVVFHDLRTSTMSEGGANRISTLKLLNACQAKPELELPGHLPISRELEKWRYERQVCK